MKTIEEGAMMSCIDREHESDYMDGFEAGAAFAQRWIPIDEELPKPFTPVLGYDTYPNLCYVVKYDTMYGFMTNHFNQRVKITHWRPIELK